MSERVDENDAEPSSPVDLEERLMAQVENWRKRLLDLGNRNPLINCVLGSSRGAVELVHPACDTIWRKLAAQSEAGAVGLRFPWRRELVPPPDDNNTSNPRSPRDDRPGADRQRTLMLLDDKPELSKSEAPVEEADKSEPSEWNPSLESCLASRRLRDTDLMTGMGDKALDRRLRTLEGHASLSMSEQGVHSLFVAFGFVKWFESADSEKELRSPLMLVPVSLSRASSDAPWELTEAEDDAIDNLCLRQRFQQDFGLVLPPLPEISELEEPGARLQFLEAVREAIADNDRWEVEDRCALGRFAFPKVAMWKDLGDHSNAVISHLLCRSIGGDSTPSPQQVFGAAEDLPDAARLDDEVPPGEIKAILDADSSQLEAVVAARRGVSFVLDGPPGTGKSQTIANIIADALGDGRRVLFVSEKVSALEVVKRRLDDCGLGDFCLECHSSKANRKAVLDELAWCLEIPAEVYDDATPKLDEAQRVRRALNEYVRAVHRPREPLGLSPYEVNGHVSRLTRLGMTTKSRCMLPDPAGVDRQTFDAWLQLLSRATEFGKVIDRHAVHPWRGCKLASRSLSLADDIHHHFGHLAKSFQQIDRALQPLIASGLIDSEVTPSRLNGLMSLLRESLASPEVPLSWFANPLVIADAVLARFAVEQVIQEQREKLKEYVDGIEDSFPDETVNSLLDSRGNSWLGRFHDTLPDQVREQREVLIGHVGQLANLLDQTAVAAKAFEALIEQLQLPIKAELPVNAFPKLVGLARAIAESGPMRPGWFNSVNWTRVRTLCDEALAALDLSAELSGRVADRVPVERLANLSSAVADWPSVEESWNLIQNRCPNANEPSLVSLVRTADEAERSVRNAIDAANTAAIALRLTGGLQLPLRSLRALCQTLGENNVGVMHGAWCNPGVRTQLLAACETNASDLSEANELKTALEETMSHRAFKPSATEVVQKSAKFRSVFKRLFGGFKAFRSEVADLYKNGVPPTKTLLSDCERLNTYHRRLSDVRETAAGLADQIPEGHAIDDCDAWTRLRASVISQERLVTAVPELATLLPTKLIEADQVAARTALDRLTTELNHLQQLLNESPLADLLADTATLDDIAKTITTVSNSAKTCRRAWEQVEPLFNSPPSNMETLLTDGRNARNFVRSMSQVSTIFNRERELLPLGAVASDRVTWEATKSGIDAAERLSGLVQNAEVLREVLCAEGRINSDALAVAADNAETAFDGLDQILEAVTKILLLSRPNTPHVEPRRRPLALLSAITREAVGHFSLRSQQLERLANVVRPDGEVSIQLLSRDLNAVVALREAASSLRNVDAILENNGAGPLQQLEDSGTVAAKWLKGVAANGSPSALNRAVASDKDQRQLVTIALGEVRRAADDSFKKSWEFLKTIFDLRADISTGITLMDSTVGTLATHLAELQSEAQSLEEWLKFSRWQRDMKSVGFESVVEELLAKKFEPHETVDVVAVHFYRQLFDHLADTDQLLGEFDMTEHERIRERFRELDEWEVKAASTRIRQFQLGRDDRPRPGWNAPDSSELGILQRETQKKRRHMSLRRLFSEIPGVLQRLKPCIMMSPLSVSTFLQSDELRFDLVIFDEASQVFPWDAIGAIYRGSQLIVAGDEKQLPPTNFFNRGDIDSEEDDDDISDFESILSLCKSINMPNKRLRWHYRSRREPLIAFSNRHFYSGDLVTFPSVRDATGDAVRLEFVPEGRWISRKNIPEAERVADLVISHHRERPEASLGVIAFNSTQEQAIKDVIHERRRSDPVIDALFDVGLTEPLFIKNLETVQGDERDVIFLSMGYGHNEAGRFLKNFGPLTKAGGERRLNVAVTRAREELVIIASVRSSDMDLTGSKSEGSQLLKSYLEYAERGVESLGRDSVALGAECESPFEAEVAEALIRRGLTPVPQVGCGGFRIDLALKHPTRPGEFCLGIECDGATYHSSRTARDRDRLRQSVLEDLGWNLVRIWSTDWVRSPERQIDRVLAAYEIAISSPSRTTPKVNNHKNGTDEEDLKPRFVEQAEHSGQTFSNIDDVPNGQIRASALVVVVRSGATDWDDLVKLTARELGFGRAGRKIRERIETVLHRELHQGALRRVGNRVAASRD